MDPKTKELRETFAKLEEKYKQIQASPTPEEKSKQMEEWIYSMFSSLRSQMWKCEDAQYAHANDNSKHLPKLTPGQMQKLIDACGATDDYNVVKNNLYCSASKSPVLEVAYTKK